MFASDQGVFLIAEGAYAPDLQLSDRPTGAAYLVGSDLVIAQETSDSTGYPRSLDGHITIFNRLGSRPLAAGDGELRLLEAGVVNGRPVALINSRTGGGLEDMDDRLLLVDLLTEHRTDLGSVGGWESSVGNVRLSSGVIAFLTSSEDDLGLRALLLDGTELWTLPIGSDSHFSVAVGTIEVAVLQPRFIDPDFTPALTLTRFSLANGSNLGTTDLTLDLGDEVAIEGGFCFTAEWWGESLLCDQTYGGPLLIDPSGAVSYFGDFGQGVVTAQRADSAVETFAVVLVAADESLEVFNQLGTGESPALPATATGIRVTGEGDGAMQTTWARSNSAMFPEWSMVASLLERSRPRFLPTILNQARFSPRSRRYFKLGVGRGT